MTNTTLRIVLIKIWYKIERLIKMLLPPISFLLILFLRIRRLRIKFCPIIATRIGHLAANTEIFLRRYYAGHCDNTYKYIGVSGKYCNVTLGRLFERKIPIIQSRLLRGIITTPVFQKTNYFHDLPFNSNEYFEFNHLPKTLEFTREEEGFGAKELERMGIGPQDWFVCFHNRDSKYLSQMYAFRDWGYHDYRDCKIDNFIPAMEYIASRGGYAIRMGQHMNEKIETNNKNIIDYASHFRSDFMDIYLSSHCKFFVGCTAGLHLVPAVFDVPIIMTNATHIELPAYRKGDLFIPKKIWDKKKNRYLTLKEVFEKRIGNWMYSSQFTDAVLEVQENNPDEILAIVIEMNSVLDGNYQYTKEENSMQASYWSLVKPHYYCYGCPARIGNDFLHKNKLLLG